VQQVRHTNVMMVTGKSYGEDNTGFCRGCRLAMLLLMQEQLSGSMAGCS
jgi:hypothetical protein